MATEVKTNQSDRAQRLLDRLIKVSSIIIVKECEQEEIESIAKSIEMAAEYFWITREHIQKFYPNKAGFIEAVSTGAVALAKDRLGKGGLSNDF